MSCNVHEFFEDFKQASSKMQKLIPDAMKGFGTMFQSIMKDGAIDVKQKELIALGIAVGIQCVPCIRLHTKKCLEAGATKEQVLEAASVSMMMGGGPAFTHMAEVIETLEALESK